MQIPSSSFLLLLLSSISALSSAKDSSEKKDAGPKDAPLEQDDIPKPTTFNGQTVPPITQLNGAKIRQDIANGNWLVEAYSPWCPHCKQLAPKWQTIYEFYYTSNPVPGSKEPIDPRSSLNSFSRYYNFKFAKLDCVAFADACGDLGVHSFPTLILFKNGDEVKRQTGDGKMEKLSGFIEESLETIRPGSRPRGGVIVPEVGAKGTGDLEDDDTPEHEGSAKMKSKERPKGEAKQKNLFQEPTRLGETPNPNGTSKPLTAESFQQHVTRTLDPWFVKFYVPWCHHCQAMGPSWAALAREMKGQINIGEVNCDIEKRLCKDAHISGYPNMVLFKGPERVNYEGLRGLGDLKDYAEKAVEAVTGIPDVTSEEFEKLEETEPVIFTYFYDHATTSEDFQALERLPLHVMGRARVVKTNDKDLIKRFRISTWPRLIVSKDGKASTFRGLMPKHMRDVPRLITWMRNNWLPLVPELSATNAHDVMQDKFAVLGILSRDRTDEFEIARREIKNAAIEWMDKQNQAFELERQELRDAKQLRVEEAEDRKDQNALRDAKLIRVNEEEIKRKEVVFAWADGAFWERWIRTTFGVSVHDGDRVIIYDLESHRYWDATFTGNPIVPSRTSILETLPKVVVNPPKLPPKATGSHISHFFFRIRRAFTIHPFVSVPVSLGMVLVLLLVQRLLRRRGIRLSNTGRALGFNMDSKEGLLGTTQPNGKVD
ncbi:MAG: hypothetical protein M1831_003952 [Alyxoria varia]|nr:MAG: hypothetical protein M1831_003952 [Alyxoria varia]